MGMVALIFELYSPNFQKIYIFWRLTNDISTIFCYLLWFQFWKKCQSLPVHPTVVSVLVHTTVLRANISVAQQCFVEWPKFSKIFPLVSARKFRLSIWFAPSVHLHGCKGRYDTQKFFSTVLKHLQSLFCYTNPKGFWEFHYEKSHPQSQKRCSHSKRLLRT